MSQASSATRDDSRVSALERAARWLWARPMVIVFVVFMAAVGARFLARDNEWVKVYVVTAEFLLAGEDIYDQAYGYSYPPFQALLAVPFAPLPTMARRVLWAAMNIAAAAVMFRAAWAVADGGSLQKPLRPAEHVACWLGLLAAMPYLLNSLSHQQTDVLLAALVFAGIALLLRNRAASGATCFGVAAAMKCTPLLLAPYLLWRGRFLAAAVVVAVALGASLLPDLIHRPADGHATWLSKWSDRYLAPMGRANHTPGAWASDIIFNQSIMGAVNRWTHTSWRSEGGQVVTFPVEPKVTPGVLRLIYLTAAGACGLIALGAMEIARRRGLTWQRRVPWECGMVLAGMLLFSPMSSPAHFGLLLLPAFLLARAMVVQRRYALSGFVLVMLLLGTINKDLMGDWMQSLGLWYGRAMWSAAAAFLGCALALGTERQHAVPSESTVEATLDEPARSALT